MNPKKDFINDEFSFLKKIQKHFNKKINDKSITVQNGDDCFCFKSGKANICITKDILIEDSHFKKDWILPEQLGEKAIEVNISDIAAMGSIIPKFVFIGLGFPPGLSQKYLNDLYKGFEKACDRYQVILAGGDTVKSDKITVSITVIGKTQEKIILRSGAQIGDLIGVTNTLGDAGAGLDLLYNYGAEYKYNKEEKYLISRHNGPKARLKEASKIARYLTSMTDSSDGLYISLNLIMEASNKGANIDCEKIPVSEEIIKTIKSKDKIIDYALFGGEDYELVFTVPKNKASLLQKICPQVSYIGEVKSSKKVKYFYNGKEKKFKYKGYKHF